MKRRMREIFQRLAALRRDDEGFVVMATLSVFLLLFVLCASIYAVGETARTKIRVQNACDAAAYSAAVVQADGLSRMATINRAMAETYIHMTNLQIDYITYRWLRLTAKRFKEDYDNAKEYHRWMITSFDPKLGWWAILDTIVDAYLCRVVDAKCNHRHEKEGIGWWCGRGPNTFHHIMFNGHREGDKSVSYENLAKDVEGMVSLMGDSSGVGELKGKDEEDIEDNSDGVDFSDRIAAEQAKIDAEYEKKINDLDPNDPDYESKRAALENERDQLKDENLGNEDEISDGFDDDDGDGGERSVLTEEEKRNYDQKAEDEAQQKVDENAAEAEEKGKSAKDWNDKVKDGDPSALSESDVSPDVNETWGRRFAELIDADKKTIEMLNASLSIVNANMFESMQSTAKFVLTSALRDPRLPADRALKNISAYFYIPRGNNPYQITDTEEQEQNFFSPLYNTEPCERLFLHMAKTDKTKDPLYKLFPVKGNPGGVLKGWGLDQWFVRAGKNTSSSSSFPTIVRTEGALGIQRAYKDANINETGAGVILRQPTGKWCVSRGNHIANVALESTSQKGNTSGTGKNEVPSGENDFKKLVDKILSNLISAIGGKLADTFCDITPSAGNASGDAVFAMCPKSSDTVALYADYDWGTAKWVCLSRDNFLTAWSKYLLCHWLLRKCNNKVIQCNLGTKTHKKKFIAKIRHRGWGHYHFPKWFCGARPRYQGDTLGVKPGVAYWTFLDMIPPLAPEKISDRHGYMASTAQWDRFFVPSKPVFDGGDCSLDTSVSPYHGDPCIRDFSRSEYRSCACFFDGVKEAWNFTGHGTAPSAAFINGHARIYGDDAEVFDDRYIGEQCQPWVLNEKFFSGLGTIVIGAAVKHENPFVQLFNFWGSDDKDMGNTVLSAFDPPSVNPSSVNGMTYQGRRIPGMNCIWAMSAARAAVRRNRRAGKLDGERMYQVAYDDSSDPHNLKIKNARTYKAGKKDGESWEKGMPDETDDPKIVAGCVCDGNSEKFKNEWNLCEQDWDATLLPLRYAGQGASSEDGVKWTWAEASEAGDDTGNDNPLNPANPARSWHPLDDGGTAPRLDSLLPDGEKRLQLERILKRNKIL